VTAGLPIPTPPPGSILLVNGASSSGKSTLARLLQDQLDQPFLHLSSDQLVDGGALPARRDAEGPFAWSSHLRPIFFDGFHRCIPAMASAGNNLVVDHIIEYPSWRRQLGELLAPFDVFLVGVHCDPDELARRERLRGDRELGEGRAHVEQNRIHQLGSYDFEVDTTSGADRDLARTVIEAWVGRSRHRGLPPST
jgi:chloramphenicol 3-O phosphotransferase